MTISTTTTLNRYVGNASTTVFPYTYRILAATDLVVTKRSASTLVETTLVYPTDYSVSGVGNTSGGSITTTTAPATGDLLVIERAVPATQPTSIRNQGSYFPETHENVFDRGTMVDQQQATTLSRTFKLPHTLDPASYTMDLPVPVAGQVLSWSSSGLTNASVSNPNVVLPGNGRTTSTLSEYLANNYVYNIIDYDADPTGVLDSSVAVVAAITAAPNGSTIVFPAGGTYLLSSATPTITGRSDLTFVASGATILLSGQDRMALKFSTGTNNRIRWYGGRIVGSGVLGDNHQVLGTIISPAGVKCHDVIVSDLNFQDVVRGVYFDVSDAFGDASDITLRRIVGTNIVGTGSGQGYGLVLSGVWRAVIDDCQINSAHRHAYYISVCERITLSNIRSEDHANSTECILIIRSKNVQGVNFLVKNSAGPCVNIEPDEITTSRDTGNIQIKNITCIDTALGIQDVMIGNSSPSTSSLLYNVLVDGVSSTRLSTATTSACESVRVRHGTNITVRNVKWYSAAAFSGVDPVVVYVAADGGDAYSDQVTVEGIRGWGTTLGSRILTGVLVNGAICTGTGRLTLRNNEVKAADAQAVVYVTTPVTNPNVDARFNRTSRGPVSGKSTLVGGTVTVTAPEVLTGDRINLLRQATGGTLGHLSVGTITNRTSFVINSSSGTDTSVVAWEIVH